MSKKLSRTYKRNSFPEKKSSKKSNALRKSLLLFLKRKLRKYSNKLIRRKISEGFISKTLFGTLCLISLLLAGVILFYILQFKPIIETPKTDVRKIPKEIKKNSFMVSVNPASSSASFRVPILMYHYIEYVKDKKDRLRQLLNINPDIFESQMKTLKNAGYTFMTGSELAEVLDGKRLLPSKPILLTFDDGHWDLYTDVLPILEKYHIHATAYIISGFIGGSDFLSKDQLRKVIQSGLVEIGAHTVHHVGLGGKLLPVVQYEVMQSKKDLEEKYGLHVVSFAYPGGSFDQQAINVVKNSGFETAVSTIPGIAQSQENRFYLYRIRPGNRTGNTLLKFLQQNSFKPW